MSNNIGKEIGKIIKGDDHVSYWVHVLNFNENTAFPTPEDCSFGTYIKIIPAQDPNKILIGVIVDTILLDKDLIRGGPRLAANIEEMRIAFPDFIDERMKLVQILLIGFIVNESINHNFPDITPHLGDSVIKMNDQEIIQFHLINNQFQIGYFSTLMAIPKSMIKSFLLRLLPRLAVFFPKQLPVLELLKGNLEYEIKLQKGFRK